MLLIHGPRQQHDLARAMRHEHEPSLRGADVRGISDGDAKTPDLDAQSRAVRLVDVLRAECAREEHVARYIAGPRLGESAREGEEHRTRRKRCRFIRLPNGVAAGIHDERLRRHEGFHILEQERSLAAAPDEPSRRRVENERRPFHLRQQRRNASGVRRVRGTLERLARRTRAQTPERNAGDDELERSARRGRKQRHVEIGHGALGVVDAAGEKETASFEVPRVRGIHDIAVARQRRLRRLQPLDRPAEVARDQRDLRLGDDASRARHSLSRPEGSRRAPEQRAGTVEISKLRHRDSAQRERRRVVSQRDSVQRAERIACGERASGGEDHRVHGNPVTLVTHTVVWPGSNLPPVHRPLVTRRRATIRHPGWMESMTMTTTMTGTREEWLAARLELLNDEKELTRRGDELARKRQALPWVRIEKDYRFDTDQGNASLADLFRGRSQLLVYHFMFGPDYKAGCPSCSSIADGFNGIAVHLENHDVSLYAVSRAPLAKLQAYKQRMGWTFPWASSFGDNFNFDFSVAFTELEQRSGSIEYNYRREDAMPEAVLKRSLEEWRSLGSEAPVGQIAASAGTDVATFLRERPGVSAFAMR